MAASAGNNKDSESVSQQNGQSLWAPLLAAIGLMADVYDFTIINLVRPVLEAEYGKMTPHQDSVVTGAAIFGAILGQLIFGAVADAYGRRLVFVVTVSLIGLSSLGSALAEPLPALGLDIWQVLTIWRFIMGIGIGGEYPLAAATTSENVSAKTSSQALSSVFAGMAFGTILAPVVVLLLAGPLAVEHSRLWRYAFGFGALLAGGCAVVRYFVLRETDRWQRQSEETSGQAVQPPATSFYDKLQAMWVMRWSLAGTAGSWFLYDVVTYGVSLYSTSIFPTRPGLDSAVVVLKISMITLPGYLAAIIAAPVMPMRQMMIVGLTVMCACFNVLAAWSPGTLAGMAGAGHAYLIIFAVQHAFDAFGPGTATFTIPGQIFPTAVRASAHGFSAATGKLGAFVGVVAVPFLMASYGVQTVMAFFAAISAATIAWSLVFVPQYTSATLEQLEQLERESHEKGYSLETQAAMAERYLFESSCLISECTPLRGDY